MGSKSALTYNPYIKCESPDSNLNQSKCKFSIPKRSVLPP